MENTTGIYAIFQKEICAIPGMPTHTTTNVDIGIGQSSGHLDPDKYNPKDSRKEEIDAIDGKVNYVDSKKSNLYKPEDAEAHGSKNPMPNSSIDLIINNTDNNKEYGIKFGQIFRNVTKNKNYWYVQPFGKISNISVDREDGGTSEGATVLLGANAGQHATYGNGWTIRTMGMVEVSRSVLQGERPSDNLVANVNFMAKNKKFTGQVGLGTTVDNDKNFCRYVEGKFSYEFSKHVSAYAKVGTAEFCFDGENKNNIFQTALGAHINF